MKPFCDDFGSLFGESGELIADSRNLRALSRQVREQAVRLYTINNAYLHNEEKEKGSLEVGKFGDLIVLDRDLMACPVNEVKDITVLATVVGGKVVLVNPHFEPIKLKST